MSKSKGSKLDRREEHLASGPPKSGEGAKIKKILDECLKDDGNRHCAECGSRRPQWASSNIGCFICLRCSGIHRNLGVHISKVRSVTLDSWTLPMAEHMAKWGNAKVNTIWEAKLPSGRKPNEDANTYTVENFIREKYERKVYYSAAKKKAIAGSDEDESDSEEDSDEEDEEDEDQDEKPKKSSKVKNASKVKAKAKKAQKLGSDDDDVSETSDSSDAEKRRKKEKEKKKKEKDEAKKSSSHHTKKKPVTSDDDDEVEEEHSSEKKESDNGSETDEDKKKKKKSDKKKPKKDKEKGNSKKKDKEKSPKKTPVASATAAFTQLSVSSAPDLFSSPSSTSSNASAFDAFSTSSNSSARRSSGEFGAFNSSQSQSQTPASGGSLTDLFGGAFGGNGSTPTAQAPPPGKSTKNILDLYGPGPNAGAAMGMGGTMGMGMGMGVGMAGMNMSGAGQPNNLYTPVRPNPMMHGGMGMGMNPYGAAPMGGMPYGGPAMSPYGAAHPSMPMTPYGAAPMGMGMSPMGGNPYGASLSYPSPASSSASSSRPDPLGDLSTLPSNSTGFFSHASGTPVGSAASQSSKADPFDFGLKLGAQAKATPSTRKPMNSTQMFF